MAHLVLVRHGATLWNDQHRFTGWGDAPLSEKGEAQARELGSILRQKRFAFDLCHTSRLSRGQQTLEILLQGMGNPNLPTEQFWRLNERHFGALQGKPRRAVAKDYGHKATIAWRRSYQARPPALDDEDPRWQAQCRDYSDVPKELLPRCESLEDGVLRVEPYWRDCLAPKLLAGMSVLLVGHTTSLRGLVRILDDLSDGETEAFRIPTAIPLVYEFGDKLARLSSYRLPGNYKNRWRDLRSRYKPRWISWM